jgi:hypothetical protein
MSLALAVQIILVRAWEFCQSFFALQWNALRGFRWNGFAIVSRSCRRLGIFAPDPNQMFVLALGSIDRSGYVAKICRLSDIWPLEYCEVQQI